MMRNKKITKKVLVTTIASLAAISCLAGCGKKDKKTPFTDDEAVVSIKGENKIDYAQANLYTRIMQVGAYETIERKLMDDEIYSDNLWDERTDGKLAEDETEQMSESENTSEPESESEAAETYGSKFKNDMLNDLKAMLICEQIADKYDVEFTDVDEEHCDAAADEFIEKSDADALKASHANKNSMKELLRLMAIKNKERAEIIKNADTSIDEEEIKQATFQYVEIKASDYDNPEEKESAIWAKMEEEDDDERYKFEYASSAEGFTAKDVSFTVSNPEYDLYGEELVKQAEKLKDGEHASYTDEDGNITLVYMKESDDFMATDDKREEIISDREQSLFQEVIDSFEADMPMAVNEEAWASIEVNEDARYDEKIIVETESETGSEMSSETENVSEPESETEVETESETTSEESSSESSIIVDGDDSSLEVNVFSNETERK